MTIVVHVLMCLLIMWKCRPKGKAEVEWKYLTLYFVLRSLSLIRSKTAIRPALLFFHVIKYLAAFHFRFVLYI